MPIELIRPPFARCLVHLPGVRLADDAGEKACRLHRIRNGQLPDLHFEILRQQLANEDGALINLAGNHPLAEMW